MQWIAGQLNWSSTETRVDLAYVASTACVLKNDKTVRDSIKANKFVWKDVNIKRGYIDLSKDCDVANTT